MQKKNLVFMKESVQENLKKDLLALKEHNIEQLFDSSAYLNVWRRNELLSEMVETIQDACFSFKNDVVLLKGASLFFDLYSDIGHRAMSDIDLLVNDFSYPLIKEKLTELGYKEQMGLKWWGSHQKSEWIYEGDITFVVELHRDLFYYKKNPPLKLINHSRYLLKKLDVNEELVYLIGHFAYQHNMQKLCWLMDIYFLSLKNHNLFDEFKIRELISYYGLETSYLAVQILMEKFCLSSPMPRLFKKTQFKLFFIKKLLSVNYQIYNFRSPIRYYLLKILMKDSFFDLLKYVIGWARMRYHNKNN